MKVPDDDEFSDGLDEFEESMEEHKKKGPPLKNQTTYANKPYDEAIEVSQDLSMVENSMDFRSGQHQAQRERMLKNDRYDEAVEVSQSLDQVNLAAAMKNAGASNGPGAKSDIKAGFNNDSKVGSGDAKALLRTNTEQTRSQSVINKPFDEALEFSHSGSDESIDTARDRMNAARNAAAMAANNPNKSMEQPQFQQQQPQQNRPNQSLTSITSNPSQPNSSQQSQRKPIIESPKKSEDGGSGSEDENEHEESYEHIEGAYNPRDYQNLNVSAEVRDLFQYIERYKPQEVELDTPLKCFIPEFIPAIGELDPFIKVSRPDKKEDGAGLRYLDEPSTGQSDPTVLELQLRAKSKKLQYGDLVVRSIENADKNPAKIEKWIQDINELHRSKPPPQVNYKKNMPDIDRLMEAWPEDFETLLASTPLPSPDLELSLPEYVKALCSILDIPVYDNPIESLHLMFTLYTEFKNNPHFQARLEGAQNPGMNTADTRADAKGGYHDYQNHNNNYQNHDSYYAGAKYGGADVLQIEQDYK